MDGEVGWCTARGKIGIPPLARVMGVGKQQQQQHHQLKNIDPDLNTFSYIVKKPCQNYDRLFYFKSTYGPYNNISFLHSFICSSENKLNNVTYDMDNLGVQFTFIGLSETSSYEGHEGILYSIRYHLHQHP